jgi:hypothetical protein
VNSILETSTSTTYTEDVPILPVLSSSIYRVRILIGDTNSDLMKTVDAAFDTCASAYIIRRDTLPAGIEIHPCDKMPNLVDANGDHLKFEGVATVTIGIGALNISADFLVSHTLSVPLILGTAFIDEHVSAIFPDQRRIVLKDLSEVAILHSSVETSSVKLDCDYLVPSFSEFVVCVTTKRSGLAEIRPASMRSRKIHAANGILEIPSSGPFSIKIANFSEDAIFLRAGTVVAYATELQAVAIINQEGKDGKDAWIEEVDLDIDLPKDIRESAMKVLESHKSLWTDHKCRGDQWMLGLGGVLV